MSAKGGAEKMAEGMLSARGQEAHALYNVAALARWRAAERYRCLVGCC